jgi:glutaminase
MSPPGTFRRLSPCAYTIGLPGKSGIGGGIVTVSPAKGGLSTFAPRLDAAAIV